MSDNKKLKGNWRLVSVVVFLVSIIFACIPVEQALPVEEAPPVEQALPVEEAPPVEEDGQEERQRTSNNNSKHFGASLKKPLWDWLELGSKLIVPLLIFIFGVWFQKRDKEKAKDNLAEEAMQAYLKSMADILLDEQRTNKLFPAKNQSESSDDNDNPVRDLARALTIAILRRLGGDSKRQARIISFLRDTELFEFIFKKASMREINLSKAKLWGANLKEAKLKKAILQEVDLYAADLRKAELYDADFHKAKLGRVNLREAKLGGANLQGAYLGEAKLGEADLQGASLVKADLQEASLVKADLQGASLVKADPRKANLQHALYSQDTNFDDVKGHIPYEIMYKIAPDSKLSNADLSNANLSNADLSNADLSNANLEGANLSNANLEGANLSNANLEGAKNLTPKQIKSACDWETATYKENENENTKYIEELKKDKSSDPREPPDCSR